MDHSIPPEKVRTGISKSHAHFSAQTAQLSFVERTARKFRLFPLCGSTLRNFLVRKTVVSAWNHLETATARQNSARFVSRTLQRKLRKRRKERDRVRSFSCLLIDRPRFVYATSGYRNPAADATRPAARRGSPTVVRGSLRVRSVGGVRR